MNISGLAAFIAISGFAASASADVIYSWAVVAGSTTLNPGETVTLGLSATHTGSYYAGGRFNVRIDGLTDGSAFAEDNPADTASNYLGRRPSGFYTYFRNFPLEHSQSKRIEYPQCVKQLVASVGVT